MDMEDRHCHALMELLKSYDFEGVVRHKLAYCFECADIKMKAASKDTEELLFASNLPPWLSKPAEEADNNDLDENNKDTRSAAFQNISKNESQAPKVVARTEQEIEEHLLSCARKRDMSDNQLEYEIKKMMRSDNVQTSIKRMELCQKVAAERRTDDYQEPSIAVAKGQSTENIKESDVKQKGKPYQPELNKYFPKDLRSKLDVRQAKRFLGILANIQQQGMVQHDSNKTDLKAFSELVKQERNALVEMVNENFPDALHYLENMVYKNMFTLVQRRALKHYEAYGTISYADTPVKTIHWSSECQTGSKMFPVLLEVLLKGKSDIINLPDMKSKVHLNFNFLDKKFPSNSANLFPINQDENVENLCREHHLQYAMDGTTACHLMCDSFRGFDYSYYIPLEIVRSTNNGNLFNYTVFGKPLPFGSITRSHVLRTYMKYLTKGSFIHHSRKARVARFESLSKSRRESEMSTLTTGTNDDMIGGILSSMNESSTSTKETSASTGKLYSSYSIGTQNVLIRGSMPLYCKEGPPVFANKPVSYESFVELFPDISPMVMSDEEKQWSHLKKVFKQSAEHVICRTSFTPNDTPYGTFSVLQYHNISNFLSNSSDNDLEFQKRLSSRTKRLESLLAELSELSPGRYMLLNSRQGNLTLLRDTSASEQQTSIKEHKLVPLITGCSARSISLTDVFTGFESRIFFQWQSMHSRAPGCFYTEGSVADKTLKHCLNVPPPKQQKERSKQCRGRGRNLRGRGGKK